MKYRSLLVYIDSREQKPFKFPDYHQRFRVRRRKKTLETGDYIPSGFDHPSDGIVVERKGFADYLSCVTKKGRLDKFKNQLERLSSWHRPCVVVEGSPSHCRLGFHQERKFHPETVLRRTAELIALFHVPIVFAENAEWAALFTLDFMIESMSLTQEGVI